MKNITLFVLLLISINHQLIGQNPTAFSCTGSDGFGYYSSSASYSQTSTTIIYASSRISKITTSTGNRVTLCTSGEIGTALNGLAFNPHDNFLYAVSRYDATQFSGKLYRIGENCQKVEIPVNGSIVKFSTNNINTIDAAGGNITSATFDFDNNYYVNTSFTNGASTGFTNKLQKIGITNNTAKVLSSVTMTCPSCTGTNKLRVTDVIFDESTGQLYGSNKETNKLYSIDASNGVLTEVGTTGITSSILGIYKNKDGKVRAISEAGNIYSVNLATGNFTFLNNTSTLNSGNADGASGCYVPPSISGSLFIDANGMTDNLVNGLGTNLAGSTKMYANLIQNGLIVKSDVLTPAGYYKFMGLFSGSYEVQIASTQGVIGQAPPAQNLPNTYQWVGDNTGITAGSDGSPNGKQNVIITTGNDKVEVNFGIDGIPVTNSLSVPIQENPGGLNQVTVPSLTFSDPEEPSISNLTIELIPNPNTLGTLYYNGLAVTAGQNIPNFNPTLLTVDPVDGAVEVVFAYFITDLAGLMSNSSTVTIPFSASVLPVELVTFSGENKDGVNIIRWTTASETNSDYYDIERRSPSGEFESIGVISASGNSKSLIDYSFIDRDVKQMAYYRLVQVDLDGHSAISSTIVVQADLKKEFSLFPTIVNESVQVSTERGSYKSGKYMIFNMTGNLMASGEITSDVQYIDVQSLAKGIFFVRLIIDGTHSESKRFIKL